jgi:hypothetical protein
MIFPGRQWISALVNPAGLLKTMVIYVPQFHPFSPFSKKKGPHPNRIRAQLATNHLFFMYAAGQFPQLLYIIRITADTGTAYWAFSRTARK